MLTLLVVPLAKGGIATPPHPQGGVSEVSKVDNAFTRILPMG
jgi:hypothetical protein